jgi:hypothetical protein
MADPAIAFDFAVSYAGEDSEIAGALADQLKSRGASVFYDRHYRSRLLGRKLHREIRFIYGTRSRFVVPLISCNYVAKYFPIVEFVVAKFGEESRDCELILPVRLDDTPFPGLDNDICYADLREHSMEQIADMLLGKLIGPQMPVSVSPDQWVATFGVVVDEVLDAWEIPATVPRGYPVLCDWLERDLMDRLHATGLEDLHCPEPSQRDGECLSVRVAFQLRGIPRTLDFGYLAWWDMLELLPFCEVYDAPSPRDT